MSLSREQVVKIAHLARLDITEDELAKYQNELSKILTMVEQMNAVDAAGVEPMAHPFEVGQRLREDDVTESNQREAFQAIAPQVEDGLYLVPKVIE